MPARLALRAASAIPLQASDADPSRYRQPWEDVANEQAKLPPSLVRRALAIIDGERQG